MPAKSENKTAGDDGGRYLPPAQVGKVAVADLLAGTARAVLNEQQAELLASVTLTSSAGAAVFVAGDIQLLRRPCVSIIGARNATDLGRARARRLGRELVERGVVVMSGLAEGIDTEAMLSAVAAGGRVVGVIGTAIDQAYPAKNKRLQEQVYRDHLLVSQFPSSERVFQSNFPKRNRLMALLSDATVVIEGSDTSGTLHQAAECVRLGRWLYIARNVVENPELSWPARFLSHERCRVLDNTDLLVSTVYGRSLSDIDTGGNPS